MVVCLKIGIISDHRTNRKVDVHNVLIQVLHETI